MCVFCLVKRYVLCCLERLFSKLRLHSITQLCLLLFGVPDSMLLHPYTVSCISSPFALCNASSLKKMSILLEYSWRRKGMRFQSIIWALLASWGMKWKTCPPLQWTLAKWKRFRWGLLMNFMFFMIFQIVGIPWDGRSRPIMSHDVSIWIIFKNESCLDLKISNFDRPCLLFTSFRVGINYIFTPFRRSALSCL